LQLKRALKAAGVPMAAYIALKKGDAVPSYEETAAKLGTILFVKPANMGSSVGVGKIHNAAEYKAKIETAFHYDRKIIIEEFIQGQEVECAVLGNREPEASCPGEIITQGAHEFYSYDAKYTDENGAKLVIPARLPAAAAEAVRAEALKTFRALECEGLGRVDCFVKSDGQVFVNEINTIPGFTKISMYPKLWEASGIPYPALITRLIELALERFNEEQALAVSYSGSENS
jgi:D-alanine-D-alanine ligase